MGAWPQLLVQEYLCTARVLKTFFFSLPTLHKVFISSTPLRPLVDTEWNGRFPLCAKINLPTRLRRARCMHAVRGTRHHQTHPS